MNPIEYINTVNRNRKILNPLLGASLGSFLGAIGGQQIDNEYAPYIGAGLGALLGGGVGYFKTNPLTSNEVSQAVQNAKADAYNMYNAVNTNTIAKHTDIALNAVNAAKDAYKLRTPESIIRAKSLLKDMVNVVPEEPNFIRGMDLPLWARPTLSGAMLGATMGALYEPDAASVLGGAALGGLGGHFLSPKSPSLDLLRNFREEAKQKYVDDIKNQLKPWYNTSYNVLENL